MSGMTALAGSVCAEPEEQLLSVTAVPAPRGRVVVHVAGELDTYTAPLVEACVRSQAIRPGLRALVIDLSGVSFLGAAALSVFTRARQTCRRRGVRLEVRGDPASAVAGLVRRTGLRVEPSRSAARDDRVVRSAVLAPAQPGPQRRRGVAGVRSGPRGRVVADPRLVRGAAPVL